MKNGRLIVFEGIDGSGKTIQAKLLLKYLKKIKISHEFLSFPRYDSAWGKMVRRYLDGEFGNVGEVSPYLASALYAGDRLFAADKIRRWLEESKLVVCDRYIGSNLAHMGAKITPSPRLRLASKTQNSKPKFINWLEEFEYKENKIPKEDLVILLSMPADLAQKLMRKRTLDIHERDVSYLERVGQVFEEIARKKKNWVRVESVQNNKLLTPQKIHEKVLEILKNKHTIRMK